MSAASVLAGTEPAIESLFQEQRAAFASNPFPDSRERRRNLERLLEGLRDRRDELAAAIDADFGRRSRYEVLFSEVYVAANAIRHATRIGCSAPTASGWPAGPASVSSTPARIATTRTTP